MSNNWAYALAVEKLSGQAVPDRAQYLRIIMAELTRLVNHSCLVGFLFNDLGTSFTPLLYAFREREKILDLFESLSGSRMMCNYQRFGGCRVDPSPEWLAAARTVVENFPRFLENWSGKTFTYNGSMVVMFYSLLSTAPWPGTGSVYNAPNRNWAFDINFLDANKLPPGTPQLQAVIRGNWSLISPNTIL